METQQTSRHRAAAIVLTLHALLLVAAFFVLAAAFEFPAILRESPLRILEVFGANQTVVQATYYVFTLTGLTFIVMAVAVYEALGESAGSWRTVALVMGVLAGLTQAIGFVRWVWLVPTLAGVATDPGASEASRDAALVVFDSFHQFAGVSVGENLSFWFQGLWTIAVSMTLLGQRRLDRRLGYLGIVCGATFVVYTLEQFGGPFAVLGQLNVVFHVVWLTWLLVFASLLARARSVAPISYILIGRKTMLTAIAGAVAVLLAAVVGV